MKSTKTIDTGRRITRNTARLLNIKVEPIALPLVKRSTLKRKLENDNQEPAPKRICINHRTNAIGKQTNSEANSSENAPTTSNNNMVVAKIEFKVGEIVWARIKGFPHWPAKIKSFPSAKMAEVVWLNDYRKTKLYRTQLFKFLKNYDEFSNRFNDTVGLEKAAKEGLILFGESVGALF